MTQNYDIFNIKIDGHFVSIPALKGDTGETGNGIASITKTGSQGLTDFYTITFTNGSTYEFQLNNGADGHNATIVGATASINNDSGIPSVTITEGGTEFARTFDFAFKNLKGDKGEDGAKVIWRIF